MSAIISEAEAPRMRDEVMPEHERDWPRTAAIDEQIRARYDGTASTSHEIGRDVTNDAGQPYPSWRIEQIAQALALGRRETLTRVNRTTPLSSLYMGSSASSRNGRTRNEPRREVASLDDAIALVKAQREDGGGTGRDDETLAIEQEALEDIKADREGQPTDTRPVCRECGQRFEPWRKYRGKLATGSTICRECLAALMRARPAETSGGDPRQSRQARDVAETPAPPPAAAPEPDPAPVAAAAAEPAQLRVPTGWYAAAVAEPTPTPPRPARRPADALLSIVRRVVPLDRPLTFLERPGNDDAMIFGLLDHLPADARWTAARRTHWIAALVATLDLLIEVADDETAHDTKEAH